MERKLREHRRKLNKSVKVHKRSRKDPGIPSAFPQKSEFVKQMQEEREKEKLQRKLAIARNDMNSLAMQAASRASAHAQPSPSASGDAHEAEQGRFFDSSKRAFYREFKQVVDNADVIITVLDARDPLGCRVPLVEEMVAASGGRKRLVLVLNKIDLVPRDVVAKWLAYLRREHPALAFKASTQSQRSHLGSISEKTAESALSSSECLGADTLIQLLKNYCRSLNLKTSIRVGVVGYPNVGKSSLINSLKRAKVCKVGATPGVTTASQEIHLDKNIKLLDCPGIVFATPTAQDDMAHMFLRNCLRVEQLDDPVSPVELILQKATPEQLMYIYSIPRFQDPHEFLCLIAKRQGKLKKGGIPNLEAAAKTILTDWNQGKIPFYTTPPSTPPPATASLATEAVVVDGWAPEFDLKSLAQLEIDTVLANVAETLPTVQPIVMQQDPAVPQLVVSGSLSRARARSGADDSWDVEMTPDEAAHNPQINQRRQKALKQAKKAALKRASQASRQDPSASMDVDEDYDFARDFAQ